MVKSGLVGINLDGDPVNSLVESIGCEKLSSPITHLGVLLGINLRSKSFWEMVETKVGRCL